MMMPLASAFSFLSRFIASSHRFPRRSWEHIDSWLRESPQSHAERLAAAVVALQLLQFVLYHARFRASHWSVRWGAWAAFYLPVPLATLAVAVMLLMRSPCPPLWLVAVFFAAGQADTMAAYSLRDADRQSLRRFAKRALTLAYVALAVFRCGDGAAPFYQLLLRPKEMISLVMAYHVVVRGLKISDRAMIPPSEICKVAADHVRFREARSSSAVGYDHNHPPLKGVDASVVAVGSLESYQSAVSGCTTLDDTNCRLGLRHPSRLLRDARLSSALFLHLLQRYGCHGAGAPPIQRCIANYAFMDVAAGDRGWERAFKLVELQLRFMHDYFFSAVQGSPSSSAYRLYRDYAVFKIGFLLSVLGLVAVPDGQQQELEAICAVCLCLPLILLELCHLLGIPNSIWMVISHICENKKDLGDMVEMGRVVTADVLEAKLELVLEQLGWIAELLPQYSLVEDFDRSSPRKRSMGTAALMGSEEWSPSQFDQLKRWIFEKAVAGSAATGRFAFDGHWPFMRARAPADAAALQWALNQETTIHTILVWHIATWFCDYMSEHTMQANIRHHRRHGPAGTRKPFPPPELAFATMLSRYCAYLVAFRPELLGEHRALTASVFRGAVKEAELEFRGLASPWERQAKMTAFQSQQQAAAGHSSPGGQNAAGGILKQGVRLGGQLMARCRGGSDSDDGWEVMADFWGEMTLHLARSGGGDAAAHVERLADGGEFVTQLWALLSNGCRWTPLGYVYAVRSDTCGSDSAGSLSDSVVFGLQCVWRGSAATALRCSRTPAAGKDGNVGRRTQRSSLRCVAMCHGSPPSTSILKLLQERTFSCEHPAQVGRRQTRGALIQFELNFNHMCSTNKGVNRHALPSSPLPSQFNSGGPEY